MSNYHFENWNGQTVQVRNGSFYDTHGGHAEEHRTEMVDIANTVADEKLKQFMATIERAIPQAIEEHGRTVWTSLIRELVGALETDVHSQVNVGFDGLREVFYGEKCQKYISDSIMKTLLNELSKIRTK